MGPGWTIGWPNQAAFRMRSCRSSADIGRALSDIAGQPLGGEPSRGQQVRWAEMSWTIGEVIPFRPDGQTAISYDIALNR